MSFETNGYVIEAVRDLLALLDPARPRGEIVALSPSGGQEAVATSAESRTFAVKREPIRIEGFCKGAAVTEDDLHQELPMRKFILPMIAVMTLGIATQARAYDSGDLISMQRALAIATDLGLVTVSHTEFAGYEWQIEGRDIQGQYMEVDVDARTGAVLNVDR